MRRAPSLLLVAMVCLTASGCVSLPNSGVVRSGESVGEESTDTAPAFDPPGPTAGEAPSEIVRGFLDAMQANPLTTAVAREFLADDAAAEWDPQAATVIYGSRALEASGNDVTVRLTDTARLDRRGAWLGRTPKEELTLNLVREKGQWRITDPPSALVVPETFFDSRFAQYSLYFFDKSAQILVPEPVYLPSGEQTATLLVAGLLKGPAQDMLGVTRSFLPASTEVDLSVPVSADGTVEVPLSDEVLDLSEQDLRMVSAQLVWTLKLVPGVQSLRITVDGSPLVVPGMGPEQSMESWTEFDPRVNYASTELFGIRDGRVVTLVGDDARRVSGVFGAKELGIRTAAVNLPAQRIAAVTTDGSAVLVGPRESAAERAPADPALVFSGGTELLVPVWDLFGQIWLVDNTVDGAVLSVVRPGGAEQFPVEGITGRDVSDFELSRDGTRLFAVVDDDGRDVLLLSRIARNGNGRVRSISDATRVPIGEIAVEEIRDIAWRTPESLAVLTGPETGLSQVVVVRIDGSSAIGDVASNPEIFRDDAIRVVSSPSTGVPLYVGTTSGQLFELAANGRWTGTSIKRGLSSPVFVG